MDRKGFIDFNTRLSSENSWKADCYARDCGHMFVGR